MVRKKTKKRKKNGRMRGGSTHGGGARKKRKKSGHRGGSGMSGTGKRSDQKKTLITKKYGNSYFGKSGVTSRGTEKDKRKRINLQDINFDFMSYLEKGVANRKGNEIEVDLKEYKILGKGDLESVGKNFKEKIVLNAKSASESALKKLEKAGWKVNLSEKIKEKNSSKKKESDIKKEAE